MDLGASEGWDALDHSSLLMRLEAKTFLSHKAQEAQTTSESPLCPLCLFWLLQLRSLDGAFVFLWRFLAFLFCVRLALLGGGVFDFGVYLTADQDGGAGEVEP